MSRFVSGVQFVSVCVQNDVSVQKAFLAIHKISCNGSVILTPNRWLSPCTSQAMDIKSHLVQSGLKTLEKLNKNAVKRKHTAQIHSEEGVRKAKNTTMNRSVPNVMHKKVSPILLIWTSDWTPALWRTSLWHRHHRRWDISHTCPQMPLAQCTGSGHTHSCLVHYTFCHLQRHTQLFLLSSYSCLQRSQHDTYTPHSDKHHDLEKERGVQKQEQWRKQLTQFSTKK